MTKNSGRALYTKYRTVIKFVCKCISFLPRSIKMILFDLMAFFPGKMGVLIRYFFFYSLVKSCGENVYIARWCTFKNIGSMVVGNNVSFHEYCYLDGLGGISIYDNVSIAHASSIVSFEHSYELDVCPIKYQPLRELPIIIESDVWIGSGVRILAGSHIGSRVVVAANSVTKGKLENGIYAGQLAKLIRRI